MSETDLKKGGAELMILALLAGRPRHGYELAQLIEQRSEGVVRFHAASLYPLLYRLEARGWVQGRWVEKARTRRRRFYRLTAQGRKALRDRREVWRSFVQAMNRMVLDEPAG
jgi:PadR family transcriptional regulator